MSKPEVWLRGSSPEFPVLVQPVAHALLEAREELSEIIKGFDDELLWKRVAGLASVGFHLQHLSGVLDRLFTYARGESLSEDQLSFLSTEKESPFPGCGSADLVEAFNRQVDKCLEELKSVNEITLAEYRPVGRAKLPSTVVGLLVHAAEHTMRHIGQLLVTVRMMRQVNNKGGTTWQSLVVPPF